MAFGDRNEKQNRLIVKNQIWLLNEMKANDPDSPLHLRVVGCFVSVLEKKKGHRKQY